MLGTAWRRALALVAIFSVVAAATSTSGAGAEPAPRDDVEPLSLCEAGQPGVIYGTEGDDVITGTAAADHVCGLGGNDRIDARGGDDLVDGGDGDDSIAAGVGSDQVFAGPGADTVTGADGNDSVDGEDGDDTLSGADGSDSVSGGPGDDSLTGGAGADRLSAGDGNDEVSGANGHDTLDGDDGTDVLDAAAGTDICVRGETLTGCESGDETLRTLAQPLPIERPVASPMTFTIDDTFPGVALTVDTAGGIFPWDVHITPARAHMAGPVVEAMAGPAFDITVPEDAPPIRGATLTLPYDQSRLDGVPEGELRIYTFDEDAQLWVPVQGSQAVDAAANTVTAPLEHFSVYAVLKVRTSDDWARIFEQTPIRCAGAAAAGVDVAFLVDTSGSMAWNDPNGLRVDGAKSFVDAMRSQDRAAVVGFESVATRYAGLTALDTPAGVTAVKNALEATRFAGGGTNISAAVREGINILSANGGDSRLRVAILLTDGESPYDTTLTAAAAEALIEIHTVSLGAGTNPALLQSIAAGTGASFRQLADASELPALYQELVGDIIGDPADDDEDGLSNCVERNGMLVPVHLTLPWIGNIDLASFITTDPADADTDDDLLDDGFEAEARRFADDPVLAAEYSFLVDAGLDTYYRLRADPTKRDTDGDGLDDGLEIANGTNPLVPDDNELGIDGLDLPPFTLFQPSRYADKPAIRHRLDLVEQSDGTYVIVEIFYNDAPVTYEEDRDCVENCDAVRRLAQERPDDNGGGVCILGFFDCVDDQSQERDIVEEAREQQGVFDGDDGDLSEDFVRLQVALQCAMWAADSGPCFDAAARLDLDDYGAEQFAEALAAGSIAVPIPGSGVGANPETMRRIGQTLIALGALVVAAVTIDELAEAVRQCFESPIARVIELVVPFVHPCERLPMFSPGGDVATAAEHKVDAIAASPDRMVLTYATAAEVQARGVARAWYIGQPGCTAADRANAENQFGVAVQCDEFPYYSTTRSGPGASLRYIPADDNRGEGNRLLAFYRRCTAVSDAVPNRRVPYLVVPVPALPVTVAHCGTT